MPIPPRPIPRTARPGSAVPRKSLPSQASLIQESRAEMALLGDYAKSFPRVQIEIREKSIGMGGNKLSEREACKSREVDLESLIVDGKGKREKRATTATTLGFQLIPNPTIITLPETEKINIPKSNLTKQSLRSLGSRAQSSPSPALAGTPTTPALVPHKKLGPEETEGDADEDMDGDWEHVNDFEDDELMSMGTADDDEGSLLGEIELEEPAEEKVRSYAAVALRAV